MRYVKQEITDFLTSTVSETYPTWSGASTYSVGDIVFHDNYLYKSSSNNNLDNNPTNYEGLYWIKWGISNKYAMIDSQATTKTTDTSDIVVTFNLGNIDTLAIGYYSAETLRIENIDNSDNVLYSQEVNQSSNENVIDYYSYIYEEYSIQTDKGAYFNIPRIGTKIRVSFLKGNLSSVNCGFLIGGRYNDMGKTLDNVNFKFNSYSIVDKDEFGVISITRRSVQDLIDFQTILDVESLTQYKRKLKSDYDIIVAFIIDDSDNDIYENIITLGKIENASTLARNHTKTYITWSVIEAL